MKNGWFEGLDGFGMVGWKRTIVFFGRNKQISQPTLLAGLCLVNLSDEQSMMCVFFCSNLGDFNMCFFGLALPHPSY